MIEANYAESLVKTSESQFNHRITGHCSINTAIDFILANKNQKLRTVTLLHLSDTASDERMFKREVEKIVDCPVYIAEPNLEILLDDCPF